LPESASGIVEPPDLWQILATRLRYAIISRELTPGQHLPELGLAERFGVSRVPVREALIRLDHEGLVRAEPRRGAFVVGMSLADIRELYEVRAILEVRGSQLAAAAATSENLANLRRIIRGFNAEAKGGDSESLAAVDIAFHREVMVAAHHRRLLATWDPLSGIIQTLLTLTNERSNKSRILSAHRPLSTAIAAGDAAAAETATLASLAGGMRNAELMWAD
jgi:GntR family transcriptional regulator of gluconate operon